MEKNKVHNKEYMYMEDLKELAGLLIEYKYALKNQCDNSNNIDFQEETKCKIQSVNNVLVELGQPLYNKQHIGGGQQ